MPTTLSMLDCLKVYRVFKATRCSVRCVVLLEGPFEYRASQDRLIVRWTYLYVHIAIRTIYADNVEHARLFESISSVQRYSLQRSMRFRSVRCAQTCEVHIRTIYADNVEHARLFKGISSVLSYSLQRSMRANMRSAPCAASGIMVQ